MSDPIIPVKAIDGLPELGDKAWVIYEMKLKQELEPKFKGQFVAIEVDSGDWFLGETPIEAALKAREKYPDKLFHMIRIGYRAVSKRR